MLLHHEPTAEGLFRYRRVRLDEARALVSGEEIRSAIGHADTAKLVARLLSIDFPTARIGVQQQVGERALVFRLCERPATPGELSLEEIERIGYEWGLLDRLEWERRKQRIGGLGQVTGVDRSCWN